MRRGLKKKFILKDMDLSIRVLKTLESDDYTIPQLAKKVGVTSTKAGALVDSLSCSFPIYEYGNGVHTFFGIDETIDYSVIVPCYDPNDFLTLTTDELQYVYGIAFKTIGYVARQLGIHDQCAFYHRSMARNRRLKDGNRRPEKNSQKG